MQNTTIHIGAKKNTTKKILRQTQNASTNGIFDAVNQWLINHSKVNVKDLAIFFRLLATMINAGLNIVKSLKILSEQIENQRLKNISKGILLQVEQGEKFSHALEKYPDVFSADQRGMILAGETSGQLNKVLLQISSQIEKAASISGKIKGAMIYPVVIMLVLLGVGIAMMVLVIPKITELFTSANVQLPFLTRILISMSNFLTDTTFNVPNWITLMLIIILAGLSINMWRKTSIGKYYWDFMLLKLPIFGEMNKKVILSRFCRGISSMTSSGIPIIKTLRIVSDTVGNEVYRKRILFITYDVKKGITIADNIQEDKSLFPSMVVSMIGVGERTAQLHNITQKIAEFYEDEVDSMVNNLSKLMEPIIILVIGVAAGLMIAAIMLPIMQIADVASQA